MAKKKGIKTDAINDFILKNNKIAIGALNKVEFRHGILYGIWENIYGPVEEMWILKHSKDWSLLN